MNSMNVTMCFYTYTGVSSPIVMFMASAMTNSPTPRTCNISLCFANSMDCPQNCLIDDPDGLSVALMEFSVEPATDASEAGAEESAAQTDAD